VVGWQDASLVQVLARTPKVRHPCKKVLIPSICLNGILLALGFLTVLALIAFKVEHSTTPSCRTKGNMKQQSSFCGVSPTTYLQP
jgi:hypothetical protein